MTTRQYSSRSQQSTLTGTITSGATSMTVVSGTTLLGGVTIPAGRTFTLVIDPDTALEEIVDATAVATNTFTITRAIDGSSAQEHSAGAVVRHMAIGRDYRDANLHAEASAYYNDGAGVGHTMHGIGSGEGDVVGTLKTQTLTNKTLTSPIISNPTFTGTPQADASIVFEGTTADAFETTLTVVDPTQDNTVTIPNTSGTLTINTATQTLTNKTLTSPVISGTPVITGLSSAGMVATSATPKDYVDSILGSATAASTSAASAATSASSAATSASSAATSASNALTSANSASASATAAATSAASAATSATAASTSASSALTSANSASASATAAATSATSAAASATAANSSAITAAASVATIAGFATTASNSASAAATSATSAAASATAAATSATSAAASATAAATSATSAAASATTAANSASAASTSATSAAASATAAATSEANASASATAAATSASSASTSASSALTSANSASISATAAATSAASAATSASSAATSYDQFDDRYLGSKTSDPTTDNDGDPLITGALYFNSVVGAMKVYDGSAWDLVAPDTSNFIDKSVLSGKGALLGASAASTPFAVTPASTNGYLLTIDSSTTSGLAWAAPVAAGVTSVSAGDGIAVTGTTAAPTVAVDSTVIRTTGGQVISANTSANALEIRQTGAGNALVVEDETNPDSTPFVITAGGNVGIGGTPSAGDTLSIAKPIISTAGTSGYGWGYSVKAGGEFTSLAGTANIAIGIATNLTAASGSTVDSVIHYYAPPVSGSGTVATQVGFQIDNSFTSATSSNIGFRSDINSGTGTRWNFYSNGTAPNFLRGQTIFGQGTTTMGGGSVEQQFGVAASSGTSTRVIMVVRGGSGQTANLQEWQDSSGNILARIENDGTLEVRGKDIEVMTIMGAY